jgi:hypothetical protein
VTDSEYPSATDVAVDVRTPSMPAPAAATIATSTAVAARRIHAADQCRSEARTPTVVESVGRWLSMSRSSEDRNELTTSDIPRQYPMVRPANRVAVLQFSRRRFGLPEADLGV